MREIIPPAGPQSSCRKCFRCGIARCIFLQVFLHSWLWGWLTLYKSFEI